MTAARPLAPLWARLVLAAAAGMSCGQVAAGAHPYQARFWVAAALLALAVSAIAGLGSPRFRVDAALMVAVGFLAPAALVGAMLPLFGSPGGPERYEGPPAGYEYLSTYLLGLLLLVPLSPAVAAAGGACAFASVPPGRRDDERVLAFLRGAALMLAVVVVELLVVSLVALAAACRLGMPAWPVLAGVVGGALVYGLDVAGRRGPPAPAPADRAPMGGGGAKF